MAAIVYHFRDSILRSGSLKRRIPLLFIQAKIRGIKEQRAIWISCKVGLDLGYVRAHSLVSLLLFRVVACPSQLYHHCYYLHRLDSGRRTAGRQR